MTVCCHELADLCDDLPNRTPKLVRQAIPEGNVFGDGRLSASQRPVGMPRQARTEAGHILQLVPALDPEDHHVVAQMMGLPDHKLHELIGEAAELAPEQDGRFAWVWYDRRARSITRWLSAEQRSSIIVRRTANV